MATKIGKMALSDIFSDNRSQMPCFGGWTMDQELQILQDMPFDSAVRHLGWRLIDSFAADDAHAIVYWAFLCALLYRWEGSPQMLAEFAALLPKPSHPPN